MKAIHLVSAAIFAAAALLSGCADYGSQPYQSQPYASPGTGIVDQIEVIRKGDGSNVAGTVIGGIVGGLIGHQIGRGSGQTAATIIGAAGGAVAGHEVARRSRGANETFRVSVRMDNGAYQSIVQDNITDLQRGDRVRVQDGRVYRY
jgi:outer membrane lipoprotein SlyB